VADYREAFVGIDVAKLRNAVAIAEAGRDVAIGINVDDPCEGQIAARIDIVHLTCLNFPVGIERIWDLAIRRRPQRLASYGAIPRGITRPSYRNRGEQRWGLGR
jgi:hypothetical protein